MLLKLVAHQLLLLRDSYTIDNLESVLQIASAIEKITSNVAVCFFLFLDFLNRHEVYHIFFNLANFDKVLKKCIVHTENHC
jgi:hypothetical protein